MAKIDIETWADSSILVNVTSSTSPTMRDIIEVKLVDLVKIIKELEKENEK